MKKVIVLLLTLTVLLASFAFVGGVSADENAEHACYFAGVVIFPGETIRSTIYDAGGNVVYDFVYTNTSSVPVFVPGNVYVPAVSGHEHIHIEGPFGTFDFGYNVNDWISGECFDDGRLNSRPDRDLAAPVAIYLRLEDFGDGFDGYDIYDIDQVAGTGTLALSVTEAEINDAYHEVLASGGNVVVAQVGDIMFTVLAGSTENEAICQVNAIEEREFKPYEFSWVCLS
jgi:hypothetical protein